MLSAASARARTLVSRSPSLTMTTSANVRVGSTDVRVASLEHLLRAKRFNGRPHDLHDIEGLLALKGRGGAPEPLE